MPTAIAARCSSRPSHRVVFLAQRDVVDDSHGTGVIGKTGRGTIEHFGLTGQVDITTGTLGKALGGAAGGFVAGSHALVDMLIQRSRPQLFSNALPATVAASSLAAIEYLDANPELVDKLHANVAQGKIDTLDAHEAGSGKPYHAESSNTVNATDTLTLNSGGPC